MNKAIHTENAPAAIGPYSQGIRAGNTVYISGQIPVDPATGAFVPGGIREQTARSLENIKAILAREGLTMADVVKTTVFLRNMGSFADMNEVYASFFTEPYPARAAFQVERLPKDALVEIEAVAVAAEEA